LELDELHVRVVVSLHLGFQTPVSVLTDLVHDEGERGGVGRDALEEPGWDDVGGGVAGDGRERLKFVGVDDVVGAAQGAVSEAGTGDAFDVSGQELDAVGVDPEVRDEASVFLKAVGAFLPIVSVGGRGAGLLHDEVFALIFQVVDASLHGVDGLIG
jgi:hypothetical protein